MCALAGVTTGLITNVAGLFLTPIAEEFGVGRGLVSVTLTITNIAAAISGLLTGRLLRRFPYRVIAAGGLILTAGSTALLSFGNHVFYLYACNAVRGFSIGIMGVSSTLLINSWFHDWSPAANSIVSSFTGVSGAVFSPILTHIIAVQGWRRGYIISSVLIIVLVMPSVLLPVTAAPAERRLRPYCRTKNCPHYHADPSDPDGVCCVYDKVQIETSGEGRIKGKDYRRRLIYALLFAGITNMCASLCQHFTGIATSYGMVLTVGGTMLGVSMVTNTCGKLFFAGIVERFGHKRSLLLYIMISACAVTGMLLFRREGLLICAAAVFGFTYTLSTVGITTLTRDLFGVIEYAHVYPRVSLSVAFSYAVFSALVGFLYDIFGTYRIGIVIVLFFYGILFVIVSSAYHRRKTHARFRSSRRVRYLVLLVHHWRLRRHLQKEMNAGRMQDGKLPDD